MIEDMMPTPCACCDGITDFRNLTNDPLGEYDMVCTVCESDRAEIHEEMMEAEEQARIDEARAIAESEAEAKAEYHAHQRGIR